MPEESSSGLRHVPAGSALARAGSKRSGMLARGRREAASADADPRYAEAVADYNAGRFGAAASGFRALAEAGHAESQYMWSTLLDEGRGVTANPQEAAVWERRAAEQGHAYAQANVSFRAYAAGEYADAFQWCQRAAMSHLPWAEFHLGLMYRKGEGVDASDREAAHWYRLAATQGHAEAARKLAELYCAGLGVQLDFVQGAAWYRRAADAGDAEAQFQLSGLYDTGRGVEHDYVQARHWVRRAAEGDHAEARREWKRREYRDA